MEHTIDPDPEYGRQWTRQPGSRRLMHAQVIGAGVPREVPNEQAAEADKLPSVDSYAPSASVVELRDYQREGIQSVLDAWQQGYRAPLVVLPTGVGKTVLAAGLIDRVFQADGARVLFLAHRKELVNQTADTIRFVSPETRVGVVQATRDRLGCEVTVASIQTLGQRSRRRIDRLLAAQRYDIVICDEAHHAVSRQWTFVLDLLREANPQMRMVGLTATPGRADGTALDSVFDTVCFERNIFEMIEQGWLVPPHGFKVTLDIDLDRVESRGGDFVGSQLSRVMNNDYVNAAVVQSWMRYGFDRKFLAFCVDIEHATDLAAEFNAAGYPAASVHNKLKTRERDRVLKEFREGKHKILTNVEIATEGYDDPSIEGILFARPTQSQTLYIQAIGRGLRLAPAKTECIVIDCVGNSDRHQPVQLASLAGFDPALPQDAQPRGEGEDEGEDEDIGTVQGATFRGEEVQFSHPRRARYRWRETSLGWMLQIPRIGYYLVAWSDRAHNRATIRFYDQRPGRRDSPAREVLKSPVPWEIAYGMVEAEMDRFLNASSGRFGRDLPRPEEEALPEVNFVDLNEGTDEALHVPETWMLRDADWRGQPATPRQEALIKKLGGKKASVPETAGEASDIISILQAERDAKMRMPATPKQLAYLRIHGLEVMAEMTKGKAARAIWTHRKAQDES